MKMKNHELSTSYLAPIVLVG